MPFRRELDRDHLGLLEDWQGNNIALACPACLKVFVVSGLIHRKGREWPNCRKTKPSLARMARQRQWNVVKPIYPSGRKADPLAISLADGAPAPQKS